MVFCFLTYIIKLFIMAEKEKLVQFVCAVEKNVKLREEINFFDELVDLSVLTAQELIVKYVRKVSYLHVDSCLHLLNGGSRERDFFCKALHEIKSGWHRRYPDKGIVRDNEEALQKRLVMFPRLMLEYAVTANIRLSPAALKAVEDKLATEDLTACEVNFFKRIVEHQRKLSKK